MADYYPVLKRAISSLPQGSGEARRAVYEKARAALLRQLSSYNPPLTPTEIADQRVALEDCIRRAEAEVAGPEPDLHAAGSPPTEPARHVAANVAAEPTVEPPPPRAAPPPREEQRSSASRAAPASLSSPEMNPFHHVEPLAARQAGAQARLEAAKPAPTLPTSSPDRQRRPLARLPEDHTEPRIGAGVSALSRTLKQADQLGGASSTAVRAARHAMDETGDAGPQPRIEPEVGEARSGERAPAAATTESVRGLSPRDAATLQWPEDSSATGRARLLFGALAVVLVLVVGGAAYGLRDTLSGLVAGDQAAETTTAAATGGDSLEPKILDRLPTEGDTPAVAPDAKTVQTEAVPVEPSVDPDLPPPPSDSSAKTGLAVAGLPAASVPADNPEFAGSGSQSAPAAQAFSPDPTTAAPSTAGDVAIGVAQKAILYEEPIPGSPGTKLDGTVVWSYVNEPALPGEKPVSQIRANVEVPELNLKMRLSIHKNDDEALPASHIVEFAFDVPSSFAGRTIDTTPGMIAKQTEEARGDPIIGAVAKVSDSLFWLALSGLDQDMTRNVQLLKERDWIDIPIRYGNRRRAILTFEKGGPGDKVFEQAFTAWGE